MNHDFETGRNDVRVQVICYDLQKVFGLPKASSNVFYYTRNMNFYDLGIHDARINKGYFHFQDFHKIYEIFPPYAREYFDVLVKSRSEDINVDVNGFLSQHVMEES